MFLENTKLATFVETGFLAGLKGYKKECEEIFQGIYAIKPDNVDVQTGYAISMAENQKLNEAISMLQNCIIGDEQKNKIAKCFLGSIYLQSGKLNDGMALLNEIMLHGDEKSRQLAEYYLKIR